MNDVGPVLVKNAVADAIIAAIRDLNPDARLLDRGSYVRVSVAGRCAITRDAVERHLGRVFRMPRDLEAVMPSFAGRLHVTETIAVWEARA